MKLQNMSGFQLYVLSQRIYRFSAKKLGPAMQNHLFLFGLIHQQLVSGFHTHCLFCTYISKTGESTQMNGDVWEKVFTFSSLHWKNDQLSEKRNDKAFVVFIIMGAGTRFDYLSNKMFCCYFSVWNSISKKYLIYCHYYL